MPMPLLGMEVARHDLVGVLMFWLVNAKGSVNAGKAANCFAVVDVVKIEIPLPLPNEVEV
jgi:hypothetical protein